MISTEEAQQIIRHHTRSLPPAVAPLALLAGRVLAAPIVAPYDIPNFRQSSMDGYAVRYEDIQSDLVVAGTARAGESEPQRLRPQHAVRIFTGAPLPAEADTIIMQENVELVDGKIKLAAVSVQKGMFVRQQGADVKAGETILLPETFVTPAVLGLIASMGIAEAAVYPAPRITLIATGRELQQAGQPLAFGGVYESNMHFLSAALNKLNITPVQKFQVCDDLAETVDAIGQALKLSDLILITGGISVGDYDFVRTAADNNEVVCQFHRVKQRPGKPLYFGTKEQKLAFGLPGNPYSVISCFYEYILPMLEKMMHLPVAAPVIEAPLKNEFIKAPALTQFLKGYYDSTGVEILEGQESFRLRSFAHANCLVRLAADRSEYHKDEIVRLRLLPD